VTPVDEKESATAGDGLLEAVRSDLITIAHRLDDAQVDSVRTDLASVMQQLEKLTSVVASQREELQKLAADRSAPPVPQRLVEQPPPTGSQGARGPQPSKQQPRPAEPVRPNGGSPAPARTPPVRAPVPAPGEPEQIDLAVPLDQTFLRPARPDEKGPS
jgi:hypothetical protein